MDFTDQDVRVLDCSLDLIWLLASLQLDFACGSLETLWFPSKLTLVFLLCPPWLGLWI